MSQALPQPAFVGGTGGPTAASPAAPPFRRSATAPRRRRRSLWLQLTRRAMLPALALGAPASLAAWVLQAPQFALADLQLESEGRVSAAWVREALASFEGENLLRLSLTAVDSRLHQHPWVKSVELHKELPHTLRLAFSERQAGAIVEVGSESFWVESNGQLIAPVTAGESTPPQLPHIRFAGVGLEVHADAAAGGAVLPTVPAALQVLAELAKAQPEWRSQLARVTALSEEDFAIETRSLPFPVVVGRSEIVAKTRALASLLPQILERYEHLEAVDLRFSRRLVLVPGEAPEPKPAQDLEPTESPAIIHEVGQ